MELIALFLASFLAATLIPLSSEVALGAMAMAEPDAKWTLLAVASFGNTLGAVVNWALGVWILKFEKARWFPFKTEDIEKAQTRFGRWGVWALLASWVPVIGDPITFAAGVLRVRFFVFLGLVALAKTVRYAIVVSVV